MRLFFQFLALLAIVFAVINANSAPRDESVRVRLWTEPGTNYFTFEGQVHRLQGLDRPLQAVAFPQKQNLVISLRNNRWQVEGFQKFPLIISNRFLALEGYDLTLNKKKVPHRLFLSRENDHIDIVGILPLENYVVGVLAHEMPRMWPLETLKAQAVAARSYAMAVMNERKNRNYHLESSVLDQMYSFLSEDELEKKYDRIVEAVRATRGIVLWGSNRKILKAYYHADCGGETASAKDAWSTSEELVSVKDSFCPQNPKASWSLKISDSELAKKLNRWLQGRSIDDLKLKAVPGHIRVQNIEVQTENNFRTLIPAAAFREAIGFFDFKSTQFQAQKSGNNWLFEGRGFGHGVGLCQWGSRYLGQQGQTYQSILQHYYPQKVPAHFSRSDVPSAEKINRY